MLASAYPAEKPSTLNQSPLFGLPGDQHYSQDAKVFLEIPYNVVLGNERAQIYLGFKNVSSRILQMPGDIHFESQAQILCQAKGADNTLLTKPKVLPNWDSVLKQLAKCEVESRPTIMLNKNEYKAFSYAESNLKFDYNLTPPGTRAIRFGVLIGENEWVFSEWKPILRLDNRLVEGEELVGNVKHSDSIQFPLYKARIVDADYLFMMGFRIARLPENLTPSFSQYEKHGQIYLSTHFNNPAVPDHVTQVSRARPVQWTPATAPHAAAYEALLKKLKQDSPAQLEETKAESIPPSTTVPDMPAPSVDPSAAVATPPQAPPPARSEAPMSRILIAVILGFAFFLGLAAVYIRRRCFGRPVDGNRRHGLGLSAKNKE